MHRHLIRSLAALLVLIAAETSFAANLVAKTDWLISPPNESAKVALADQGRRLTLENGLVRRTFLLAPNAATVGLDNLMTGEAMLRAVEPEAVLKIDGVDYPIGGLKGQPDRAYLLDSWIAALTNAAPDFKFVRHSTGRTHAPFAWKQARHAGNGTWPAPGASLTLEFAGDTAACRGITVGLHYEIYDGIPVIGKWLTVSNATSRTITVDRLTTERLAIVEAESAVDERQLHIGDLPRDSDGSAKIALIAIDRSLAAWARLREHFAAEHGDTILALLVQLERLRRAAETKFPDAREFRRPGFD